VAATIELSRRTVKDRLGTPGFGHFTAARRRGHGARWNFRASVPVLFYGR